MRFTRVLLLLYSDRSLKNYNILWRGWRRFTVREINTRHDYDIAYTKSLDGPQLRLPDTCSRSAEQDQERQDANSTCTCVYCVRARATDDQQRCLRFERDERCALKSLANCSKTYHLRDSGTRASPPPPPIHYRHGPAGWLVLLGVYAPLTAVAVREGGGVRSSHGSWCTVHRPCIHTHMLNTRPERTRNKG